MTAPHFLLKKFPRRPRKVILELQDVGFCSFHSFSEWIRERVSSANSLSYVVEETHPVPSQWTEVAPAPAKHIVQLQIGLKQGQFEELERHLYEGIPSHLPRLL